MTKSKLKAPVKPTRPQKPCEPNKNQKTNEHRINIDHLFSNTTYYGDNGEEISEEQYNKCVEADEECCYEPETEETAPSLKQLLELVPPGINTNDIFIDLSLRHGNYNRDDFESIDLLYTTPFDYEKELKQYHIALAIYEADTKHYNEVLLKQYQKELAIYKEEKEKTNIANKKASLEAQLAALNNA